MSQIPTFTSELRINIKELSGGHYFLNIDAFSSVWDLKGKINTISQVAPERQRLIFSGRELDDDKTLRSYNVEEGRTVHMVKRPVNKRPKFAPLSQNNLKNHGIE